MNITTFGNDVRQVVATVAPTLGTALGGPLGGAAGTWIAKALGGGDPKKAADAILAGDPQTYLALQKLDTDFKSHLADLGVSEDQIEQQDRASARDMAEKTGNIWIPATIAAFVIIVWCGIQATLLVHLIPDANRDLISRTLGTLDLTMGTVIGYYFGSSAGSNAKNEIFRMMGGTGGKDGKT